MALLRRFLKNSCSRYIKPSYLLKPVAALHTHGSSDPQSLSPAIPWLLNPQALNSQAGSIFDLLEKSRAFGHFDPTVDSPSQHCGESVFSKLLEECGGAQKLLERSESKVVECCVWKVPEGSGANEEGVKIWADSVKKKRRKKMNKHKYKKLRKRLRKKTKK